MALPSALTLASLAFVAAAAVGLVAVSSSAGEEAGAVRKADPAGSAAVPAPSGVAPTEKPDRPRRDSRVDVVPKTLVDVYNNSGIDGLAADKSAFLQGAGWSVASTDDWYGEIDDDTVYFPAKLADEARQLAGVLRITRLRPTVSPMQFDRLTVIFTSA